jgi:hypothetical protein
MRAHKVTTKSPHTAVHCKVPASHAPWSVIQSTLIKRLVRPQSHMCLSTFTFDPCCNLAFTAGFLPRQCPGPHMQNCTSIWWFQLVSASFQVPDYAMAMGMTYLQFTSHMYRKEFPPFVPHAKQF